MSTESRGVAEPRRRWRHVSDPVLLEQRGEPPAGELRDVGVTVTAYEPPCPGGCTR